MKTAIKTEERSCEKHGVYEARNVFRMRWTGCPTCQEEADARQRHMHEQQVSEQRRQSYLLESGIIGRYIEATFDNFVAGTKPQRDVLQACQAFADAVPGNQGVGIWLVGQPGTGKTHLGCAMVHHVITQHTQSAQIASTREIIRRLRNAWRHGSAETEDQIIEKFGRKSLLVLDEVGGGFATEGEQVQLFDVLDLRYQLKRPTVLLSNLTPVLLRPALGDKLYDRLREGAKVLACEWQSHRARRLG